LNAPESGDTSGDTSDREKKLILETCAFVGRFIGLAISNGERIPLALCPHVARFLMGQAPVLSDLRAVDLDLYQQLNNLLQMKNTSPDTIQAMELTFTVGCPVGFGPKTLDLTTLPTTTDEHAMSLQHEQRPHTNSTNSTNSTNGMGSNILGALLQGRENDENNDDDAVMARTLYLSQVAAGMAVEKNTDDDDDVHMEEEEEELMVTSDNVEEFVELYASAILRWNVLDQLTAMRDGLMEFIPPGAWRGGSPLDFNLLVGGTPKVTLEELKKRTHISGGSGGASTQLIAQWFWNIVSQMTQLQISQLLYFSTGSTRLPSGTSKALVVEIVGNVSASSLPTATTCSLQINMPSYSSEKQMQMKLLLAIENCTNYELQ